MSAELKPFVSVEALSLVLGVKIDAVRDMIRAQQLPTLTLGRLRKVPVIALARFLENGGMAEAGHGVTLIRDAQRRALGETLEVDTTYRAPDRTAIVAVNVAAHEKNWATQDANIAAAKARGAK
jgi:hypothetical protein